LKIAWTQTEQYIDSQEIWESEYTFEIMGEPPEEPDNG
jgi:hypothetical protein